MVEAWNEVNVATVFPNPETKACEGRQTEEATLQDIVKAVPSV